MGDTATSIVLMKRFLLHYLQVFCCWSAFFTIVDYKITDELMYMVMNVKNNRRKVRKYTYYAFQCIIVVCADELSKFLFKQGKCCHFLNRDDIMIALGNHLRYG